MQHFCGHAAAIVAHLQRHLFRVTREADARGRGAGVAADVAEAFLHDAEQRQLDFVGRSFEIGRRVERDVNAAALREALGVFADGGGQPQFIQQRWMQQVGMGADFLRTLLDHRQAVGEQLFRAAARGARGVLKQPDGHAQRGKFLAGGIVQLAGDAAAFLLFGAVQLRRQHPQFFLRPFALGGVESGSDDAHDFPSLVSERIKTGIQHAKWCALRIRPVIRAE